MTELLNQLRELKPYLIMRREHIQQTGKTLELRDELDDIEVYLDIMKDSLADKHYGIDMIKSYISRIHDMIRQNPITEPVPYGEDNSIPTTLLQYQTNNEENCTRATSSDHHAFTNSSETCTDRNMRPPGNLKGWVQGNWCNEFDYNRGFGRGRGIAKAAKPLSFQPQIKQEEEPKIEFKEPDWLAGNDSRNDLPQTRGIKEKISGNTVDRVSGDDEWIKFQNEVGESRKKEDTRQDLIPNCVKEKVASKMVPIRKEDVLAWRKITPKNDHVSLGLQHVNLSLVETRRHQYPEAKNHAQNSKNNIVSQHIPLMAPTLSTFTPTIIPVQPSLPNYVAPQQTPIHSNNHTLFPPLFYFPNINPAILELPTPNVPNPGVIMGVQGTQRSAPICNGNVQFMNPNSSNLRLSRRQSIYRKSFQTRNDGYWLGYRSTY